MRNSIFNDVPMYFPRMVEHAKKKKEKKYKNKNLPLEGKDAQFFLLCDIWCMLETLYHVILSGDNGNDKGSDSD